MTSADKHCLLVVDDEHDVCDSVHDLLRREFVVLKATSAAQGYRLLQENDVHIIMTDQRMPQITGVELLANVRVRYPQAVRLLFTGYADLDSIIAAINQGRIFQFVKKPWQPEELQTAVRQAAAEYDRLVEHEEKMLRLRTEVQGLYDRLTVLEKEVQQLRQDMAR
jgi:DNA-binding NtrC family response regulator